MATGRSKLRERAPPRRARRDEVISAAAAVFSEKGYHGASTQDIADRLGIRQGSLYYYFPSKEAALEEVCRIGISETLVGVREIAARDCSPREKIHAAVAQHLNFLGDWRHFMRTFIFCHHDIPAPMRREVRRLSSEYEGLMEAMFAEGVKDGSLRSDIDCRVSAQCFFGLVNVAVSTHRPNQRHSVPVLIDLISKQMLRGVES